jgi:hypothetical protein
LSRFRIRQSKRRQKKRKSGNKEKTHTTPACGLPLRPVRASPRAIEGVKQPPHCVRNSKARGQMADTGGSLQRKKKEKCVLLECGWHNKMM